MRFLKTAYPAREVLLFLMAAALLFFTPVPALAASADICLTAKPRATAYRAEDRMKLDQAFHSVYEQVLVSGKGSYDLSLNPQDAMDYICREKMLGDPFRASSLVFWSDGSITLKDGVTDEEKERMRCALQTQLDTVAWIQHRTAGMTADLDTVKTLYSELVNSCSYDETLQNASAYRVLSDGKATCNGFSHLFLAELEQLGVEAYLVSGTAEGGPHAWNVFVLDGVTYTCDPTFAACCRESEPIWDYFKEDASMTLGDGRIPEKVW